MLTWVDPDLRKKVAAVLKSEGADILPFKVSLEGLTIESD
jgi:hypothetical protein